MLCWSRFHEKKWSWDINIFLTQYNPSMKLIASSPRQLYWYIWLNVFCGNVLGWIECPKCEASTLFSLYQKHTGPWTIFWAVETPVPDSSSHISSHARALCYQYAPLLGVYKSDQIYFICYLNSIPDGIISEQAELYKTRDCRGGRQKSNGEAVLGTSIESWLNLLEVERRLGTWR